jgi:phosphatidylinositol glycan class M
MAVLLIKITSSNYKNLRLFIFLMTYVFVLFNKVLTVQYYMWIFGALTLIINSLTYVIMKRWRALMHMFATWFLGVLVWVWCAEKIEGQGQNLFGFMWVVCLARFVG